VHLVVFFSPDSEVFDCFVQHAGRSRGFLLEPEGVPSFLYGQENDFLFHDIHFYIWMRM